VVHTLVAHEPPLLQLLPEGDARRTSGREIYDTYQQEGAEAAIGHFAAVAGMEEPAPEEMSPEEQEAMAQEMARLAPNMDFFFAHYLLPITEYEPDLATLETGSLRVLVGVGEESAGTLAYETAVALAEGLGTPPVTFPGDHVGMFSQPEAFAARLREVLMAEE
jgi:hypothetical protein